MANSLTLKERRARADVVRLRAIVMMIEPSCLMAGQKQLVVSYKYKYPK